MKNGLNVTLIKNEKSLLINKYIPNPQSPIPNPQLNLIYLNKIYIITNKIKYILNIFINFNY